MDVKMLSLKMRRDWHYFAVAIGLIFIANGIIGLLGFQLQGWKNYALELASAAVCFWLAGKIIRRPPEPQQSKETPN